MASPAEDLPEHGRATDQREEALGLPRVRHETGESPDRHAEEELGRPSEQPQRRVDPVRRPSRGATRDPAAISAIAAGIARNARPRPSRPSRTDTPSVARNIVAPRKTYRTRQVVDPTPGEQEGVDAARGEREPGRGRERGRGGRRRHDPSLPGQQSQQPVHRSPIVAGLASSGDGLRRVSLSFGSTWQGREGPGRRVAGVPPGDRPAHGARTPDVRDPPVGPEVQVLQHPVPWVPAGSSFAISPRSTARGTRIRTCADDA